MTPHIPTKQIVACTALLLGLVWSVQPLPLHAQSTESSNSTRTLLLDAKTTLDHGARTSSIDSLKKARTLFKQAVGDGEHQALAHYYAALANVRIMNQLPEEPEDRRDRIVDDAITHLKEATTLRPKMADAWALLTSCYGQKMGLHPMKGRTLNPKSKKAMKKAQNLAPNNPRVWLISGRQDYFTPKMFGGDKEQGLKKFEKAARLAEQETVEDPLQPSWGHAEAYAWIGYAHMEAERYDEARTAFDKALEITPDYAFVKNVLLPKLEKKTE